MRQVPVFFYGLFMDPAFLERELGRVPDMSPGSIGGFRLRLSRRAYLESSADGNAVWGMLAYLTWEEVTSLYEKFGLSDYGPEPLLCETGEGDCKPALTMNLAYPPAGNLSSSGAYRRDLMQVLERVGAPKDYLAQLSETAD